MGFWCGYGRTLFLRLSYKPFKIVANFYERGRKETSLDPCGFAETWSGIAASCFWQEQTPPSYIFWSSDALYIFQRSFLFMCLCSFTISEWETSLVWGEILLVHYLSLEVSLHPGWACSSSCLCPWPSLKAACSLSSKPLSLTDMGTFQGWYYMGCALFREIEMWAWFSLQPNNNFQISTT